MMTVISNATGKTYRCRKINADRYHIIGTCAFYTARQLKERYKVIQEDEA